MKKRIAKVMLLSVVLPGGVHAVEMKTNSSQNKGHDKVAFAQTAPLVSKDTIVDQGKEAESGAMAVDAAKTGQVATVIGQGTQNEMTSNPAETKAPVFRVRGIRG
jgi:hypothetical protein